MSVITDPSTLPLTPDQIAAIDEATRKVTEARKALQAVANDPAVLDALRTWGEATSVNLPEEQFAAMSANWEEWRTACGLDALSDAAWPVRDLIDVLSLEVSPQEAGA